MVLLLALDIDLLQSVSVHCTHVHTKVTDSGSVTCGGSCQVVRRFVSGFAEVGVRWCGGSCQVLRRFVSGVITAYIARLPSLKNRNLFKLYKLIFQLPKCCLK